MAIQMRRGKYSAQAGATIADVNSKPDCWFMIEEEETDD